MSINAVDLFCGVGGLTRGILNTGINVVAGFDFDNSCKYAYEKNNKVKFFHKDIRKVEPNEISSLYPEGIKLLMGCAPCQPFSAYIRGKLVTRDSNKRDLLYEFSRIINEVKPEIVSMENVPQITKETVFEDFINDLKELNYHVSWKIVFCPDYGIPQSRSRMVLLASKLGKIKLLQSTHSLDNYNTVRDVIGNLDPLEDGVIHPTDLLHRTSKLLHKNKLRIKASRPGGTWLDWNPELRTDCHKKSTGNSYKSVYGRMEWDKPSPTITTQFFGYGNGRFGHPEQDRALSLREGAILQTFPPDYDFIDPNSHVIIKDIGRQIGNAVPVRLAEIIGLSIIEHLKECKLDATI